MIRVILSKIFRTLVPKVYQSKIDEKRRIKKEEREKAALLFNYGEMCSAFPGFISLPPYVKKDKVFDGTQYYAQFYQDYFLDKYIFRGKRGGFFLDVGGNDPIYINNTYFFEKNREWSGLAFEPMPLMNAKWKEERKVECIQAAVGDHYSKATFCEYEDNYMSGISGVAEYDGNVKNTYEVDVVKIGEVLRDKGVEHVDFMSLDIEGAELEALKGIDFDIINIDFIVVENNKGKEKEQQIRDYLLSKGYLLIARLWIDDIWAKNKPDIWT